MRITSRASDYALLLLIHLASLPENEATNVKKIGKELNLSVRFLANIANKLTLARVIHSNRGVGGGVRLAKSASEISIKEVIESVEGPVQTMFCQNTADLCHHETLCSMKHFWDEVQDVVIEKLKITSIATLAEKNRYPV